jgi:hypothetical protein
MGGLLFTVLGSSAVRALFHARFGRKGRGSVVEGISGGRTSRQGRCCLRRCCGVKRLEREGLLPCGCRGRGWRVRGRHIERAILRRRPARGCLRLAPSLIYLVCPPRVRCSQHPDGCERRPVPDVSEDSTCLAGCILSQLGPFQPTLLQNTPRALPEYLATATINGGSTQ